MKSSTIIRSATGTLLTAALLAAATPSLASTKYECHRYVNNKPEGHVNVSADTGKEAEQLALDKYRNKLKKKVDYVKCKVAWF